MQAVCDKAFATIVDQFKKDTIERFSKLLLQSLQQDCDANHINLPTQEMENDNDVLISSGVLDPSTTSDVISPAFMVAIGSNPGAGKTTLVGALQERFLAARNNSDKAENNNDMFSSFPSSSSSSPIRFRIDDAIVSDVHILPMDGYHRYRSELSAMKDPEEAFRRRGAPFTFNDEKYAANLEQLRKTGKLNAPAFTHSKKDPEEDFYKVDGRINYKVEVKKQKNIANTNTNDPLALYIFTIYRPIVIFEGLYCLFDEGEFWAHAVRQFDLRFFLKVVIDVATERLTKRHMRAWGISEAEARLRAAGSDRDNGLMVIERAIKMAERGECVVLESVEDVEFAKKQEKHPI